ncbi:MAG: 16S rRNA methyltransferase [Candidatus Caldarchaeum sp.]|nr:16S rRNA methyltransferase [Candidatus Caldarchaeum sp.]MDW8359341.1 16S rRNA methyltransferase [Candidatus Caldarchaeum sp.]
MDKLILVLVETAVETVPPEIQRHPAVLKHAERRGKHPSKILLDRSYHHWAMKNLPEAEKRGRPDILHFCLLEALGSPLNLNGLLETYAATLNGYVVHVNPAVRLPRVYERFKGLMEKLFEDMEVVSSSGETLLRLERASLRSLVERLTPSRKILMTEKADTRGHTGFASLLTAGKPMVMVGGFPHGDFRKETEELADVKVALAQRPLEAWTVVSRVLCLAEWMLR